MNLDGMLTPDEAAAWLQLSTRTLLAKAKGRAIPSIRINARVIRFHPRSVLEYLSGSNRKARS